MKNHFKKQKGFTLLELVIVLAVVSLIVYSILKGAAMMSNAESKRLIEDIESFSSAYYAYQDRVGRLPGQIAPFTISNAVATTASNNDFFGDLFNQGFLVTENPIPSGNIASSFEVYNVANQTIADTNNAVHVGVNQLCITQVEGMLAQGIDYKLDDGQSNTGIVKAETGVASPELVYERGVFINVCIQL